MATLEIAAPAAGSDVVAGQGGTVHVNLHPSWDTFPSSIHAEILDAQNTIHWDGDAAIANDTAIYDIVWPDTPGTYRIHAICYGVVGITLAEAMHEFHVQPKVVLS